MHKIDQEREETLSQRLIFFSLGPHVFHSSLAKLCIYYSVGVCTHKRNVTGHRRASQRRQDGPARVLRVLVHTEGKRVAQRWQGRKYSISAASLHESFIGLRAHLRWNGRAGGTQETNGGKYEYENDERTKRDVQVQ